MKSMDQDSIKRMIELADKKYNCSQILMTLAMDDAGVDRPELVKVMSGLGDGCGFFEETCGIMTSAAAILSWHGARGSDDEIESEHFLPMLQAFGEWFQKKITSGFSGSRCKDIVGDKVGTEEGKLICGGLIYEAHEKLRTILAEYGYLKKAETVLS